MEKILIVEDDPDIQELLENHLAGAGYRVVSDTAFLSILQGNLCRHSVCL